MPGTALFDALSALLQPSFSVILFSVIVAVSLPVLVHLLFYRSSSSTLLPSFLLVGPSGSGKTSLVTLFERGKPASTHVSQAPLTVEVSLPVSKEAASSRYRSTNDPSNAEYKRCLLIDTPGHGKLRQHAVSNLKNPQNIKGLIFVVDAANLTAGSPGLREAAEFLHDVLLLVQKRATSGNSKSLKGLPVLVAANKIDLFTALPPEKVRKALEQEISSVRASKSKGLLDSGIGMDDTGNPDQEWLGEGGNGQFEFSHMEEFNVSVTVKGGHASGSDGINVERWWDWIGECL